MAFLSLVGLVCSGCDLTGDAEAAERVIWRGRVLSASLPRPQFTLRDASGGRFVFDEETRGRPTLLFFGYTSCPDVCPMHFGQIAAAMRELEGEFEDVRERVRVVFVGVDAPRDTGERVRSWLDHFDPSFVGLVGSPEELQVAQRAAAVPQATRDPGGSDQAYTVSHASYVLLYTSDDQAHLRYAFDTSSEDWVHDLAHVLRGGWRSS